MLCYSHCCRQFAVDAVVVGTAAPVACGCSADAVVVVA